MRDTITDSDKHSCQDTPGPNIMDQEMPLLEALQTFPAAVFWSVCISAALIMQTYDTSILISLPSTQPFNQRFGFKVGEGPDAFYQIDATFQSLLVVVPAIGQIIGLLINGWATDRWGHKKVILASIVAITLFLLIPFFAPNTGVLIVGLFIIGLPLGVLQTACVAYASEACPITLRAQLTTYTNFSCVLGLLIGSAVGRAFSERLDEWSYKGPMSIQWVWPVPLAILTLLAPESPWWLLGKGRREEARTALRRLADTRRVSDVDIDMYMISMDKTLSREILAAELSNSTSYLDCFRGTNLRRTEIVVITWINQVTSGATIMGSASYFFQYTSSTRVLATKSSADIHTTRTIGLSTSTAFTVSIVLNVLGLVGTAVAWPVMQRVGRRDMYLHGSIGMTVCMLWMGIASVAGPSHDNSHTGYSSTGTWAIVASLLVWVLFYQTTVGPICYAIVTEIPSSTLRSKTMVLGCAWHNAVGIPMYFLSTRMLNPSSWNWSGKSGFFWAGITLLVSVWVYFRLPETKGRTYAELDILFENMVDARKFQQTTTTTTTTNETELEP